MVMRAPFILVIAVISVVGTIIYLANTQADSNNTDRRAVLPDTQTQTFHFAHSVSSSDARLESFPIRNVEHFNSIDRAGDAETQPTSLKVSSDIMTLVEIVNIVNLLHIHQDRRVGLVLLLSQIGYSTFLKLAE